MKQKDEFIKIEVEIIDGILEGTIKINDKVSHITGNGAFGYSEIDHDLLESNNLSESNQEFIDDLTSALHAKIMSYHDELSGDDWYNECDVNWGNDTHDETPNKILLDFINSRLEQHTSEEYLRHTYYIYLGDITYNEAMKAAHTVNDLIKSKKCYKLYRPHVTISCPQQDTNTYLCAVTLYE